MDGSLIVGRGSSRKTVGATFKKDLDLDGLFIGIFYDRIS